MSTGRGKSWLLVQHIFSKDSGDCKANNRATTIHGAITRFVAVLALNLPDPHISSSAGYWT